MPSDPAPEMPVQGLLAIDTSTDQAGIALATGDGIVSHSWPAARAQTTTVLPEIDRLVRESGLVPTDITGLVVATGPGTFTGLRVGLAIAKGIVSATGVPLVGIPTLDIVFAMHPNDAIIAVLPAGRGRVVWQLRGGTPHNSTVDELIAEMDNHAGISLVGELSAEQAAALAASGFRLHQEFRDPATMLQLGSARIAANDLDDPVSLQPTYLHGITVNAGPVEDRLNKA